jgi:hypothetical protein
MPKTGGNTGGIEQSPRRRASKARRRRNEEQRWAARSGPVTVTRIEDRQGTDG